MSAKKLNFDFILNLFDKTLPEDFKNVLALKEESGFDAKTSGKIG